MLLYSSLGIIKRAVITKSQYAYIKHSAKSYLLCKLFYKLGYLSSYIYQNNKIKIYLAFYEGVPILQSVNILSRPGNHRTISYYKIKSILKMGKRIYILSTHKGLISSTMAIRLKIGGELLCELS